MKNNPLIIVALIMSMTLSSFVHAQNYSHDSEGNVLSTPPFPPIPSLSKNEVDIGKVISPMKKGQIAPFTGLLISPATIASIITDIQLKDEEIQTEVQRAIKTLEIQHDYAFSLEKIRNESDNRLSLTRVQEQRKEIDRLDAALKKEKEDRPNPTVWATIGVVAGVLISTLTASAVIYVTKQ